MLKHTCPRCGEVRGCDECGAILEKPYLAAKLVLHDRLSSTPIVWGEWCSSACFVKSQEQAFAERQVTERDLKEEQRGA